MSNNFSKLTVQGHLSWLSRWRPDLARLALAYYAFAVSATAQPLTGVLDYRNPVIQVPLSGPAVIRHGGLFYLYANGEVYEDSGTRVFFSPDLVHWQRGPIVLQLDAGMKCLWPDIWRDPDSGRFLLYYTQQAARNGTPTLTIRVADGAKPLGPFATVRKLVDGALAPHLFRDDDGRRFLYFVRTSPWAICVQPMLTHTEVDGEPTVLLEPQSDWETTGHTRSRTGTYAGPFLIGDPWMIKHRSRYYLLYSGGAPESPDSAIGYATADTPLGPFTRAPENPILRCSETAPGPGGGSVILDDGGQCWFVYARKRTTNRNFDNFVCLDRLGFDRVGRLGGRMTWDTYGPAPDFGHREQGPLDVTGFYYNPILDVGRVNPSVIRHEGVFYLYVESWNEGIRVFTSGNLTDWSIGREVFRPPNGERCGTPDVWRDPGSGIFYLYCDVGPLKTNSIYVAQAAEPRGLFTDPKRLVQGAYCPCLFRDEDGKLFLYYTRFAGQCICVQAMRSPVEPLGEPQVVLRPQENWETRVGPALGMSSLLKHAGRYYLLYRGSGPWHPNSGVGYATAANPLGPFTKSPDNPILRGDDRIFGPSEGSAIQDSAGHWWLLYNQKRDDGDNFDRFICLDRLWFDDAGRLHSRATLRTVQPAPIAGGRRR